MNVFVLIVRYIFKISFIIYFCPLYNCIREYLQQAMHTNLIITVLFKINHCGKTPCMLFSLRLLKCNGFTCLQLKRGFKNLL